MISPSAISRWPPPNSGEKMLWSFLAGHWEMPRSRHRILNVVRLEPTAAQTACRLRWNILRSFACSCAGS
jgi:hypothetical protein